MAEALIDAAAGPGVWAALPPAARDVLTANGPALLAGMRAYEGARLDAAALDRLGLPTLLVAAEDSPPEVREPVLALARALPRAQPAWAAGGHLIDPAGPEVLAFLDEVSGAPGGLPPAPDG